MTIHIEISLKHSVRTYAHLSCSGFRCVHVCHINGDSFAFKTTILLIILWFYDNNVIKLVQHSIDECRYDCCLITIMARGSGGGNVGCNRCLHCHARTLDASRAHVVNYCNGLQPLACSSHHPFQTNTWKVTPHRFCILASTL